MWAHVSHAWPVSLPAGLACCCLTSRHVLRAYPGMLEKAALAHIAVGFKQRRPSLVRLAEKMLSYVPVGFSTSKSPLLICLPDAPAVSS